MATVDLADQTSIFLDKFDGIAIGIPCEQRAYAEVKLMVLGCYHPGVTFKVGLEHFPVSIQKLGENIFKRLDFQSHMPAHALWTPVSVGFRHPLPKNLTVYQQKFRCPLEFYQPVNFIQMDRELLQVPMLQAEPGLCAVLERYGEDLLKRFPPVSTFLDSVRGVIIKELQKGNVRSLRVSTHLGIVPRTLQRQLREAGTSYGEVLDEIRRELSVYYLRNSDIAIYEVAFLLGFSETTSFNRAFKRWYDLSPREFRKKSVIRLTLIKDGECD